MKSALIKNILEIWCKIFNTKWKKAKKRDGDKDDEYLIADSEIKHTIELKLDNKMHFLIDFANISKKPIRSAYSTKNSKKLNKKEIKDLILNN